MTRSIKCMFANVNSLVSRHKKHFLNLFLKDHRPDVMMLAEHMVPTHANLVMEGYKTFLQRRIDRTGRGTAILVKQNIKCEQVVLDSGSIENCCIKLFRVDGSTLHVVSMYCRPGDGFNSSDLECLRPLARDGHIIIGADLNARHISWGGTTSCSRGRSIADFILGCPDLTVIPTDGPTRISRSSETYIDICLASPGIDIDDNGGRGISTTDCNSDNLAITINVRGNHQKCKIF